jgi:hypothetical protein
MPSYDICYLNADGTLACTFSTYCDDDLHAKVLAHAMKLSEYKTFEVWTGKTLVYERPNGPRAEAYSALHQRSM